MFEQVGLDSSDVIF